MMAVWLLKRVGSTWFQVANVLSAAVTQIFLQFKFLVGERAATLTYADWIGVIILIVGFWVYNLHKEIKRGEKSDDVELARLIQKKKTQDATFAPEGFVQDPNFVETPKSDDDDEDDISSQIGSDESSATLPRFDEQHPAPARRSIITDNERVNGIEMV